MKIYVIIELIIFLYIFDAIWAQTTTIINVENAEILPGNEAIDSNLTATQTPNTTIDSDVEYMLNQTFINQTSDNNNISSTNLNETYDQNSSNESSTFNPIENYSMNENQTQIVENLSSGNESSINMNTTEISELKPNEQNQSLLFNISSSVSNNSETNADSNQDLSTVSLDEMLLNLNTSSNDGLNKTDNFENLDSNDTNQLTTTQNSLIINMESNKTSEPSIFYDNSDSNYTDSNISSESESPQSSNNTEFSIVGSNITDESSGILIPNIQTNTNFQNDTNETTTYDTFSNLTTPINDELSFITGTVSESNLTIFYSSVDNSTENLSPTEVNQTFDTVAEISTQSSEHHNHHNHHNITPDIITLTTTTDSLIPATNETQNNIINVSTLFPATTSSITNEQTLSHTPYQNISSITLTLPNIKHVNSIGKQDMVNIVTITFITKAIDIFRWVSIFDAKFRNFTCNLIDSYNNWCTIDRIIYVSPSPLVMNNHLIINFFIDDSKENDLNNHHVFPGPVTVEALKNSTNILEKIMGMKVMSLQTNLGTMVVKPLETNNERLAKFELLVFLFTIVMFICTVLLCLAIICSCAKRKSVDMNPIELSGAGRHPIGANNGGIDLNSASNILRDENHQKRLTHVINIDDGWVTPIDDVIKNENFAKYDNLQDTKL